MSVVSRFRQGIRALTAFARPVDLDLAERTLSPELFALFKQMRRTEQQHSLNVLRALQGWGYGDPALMVAALLHDVGKSRYPLFLWDKVIVVLARSAAPNRVRAWGTGDPNTWRRPFVISAQHPTWSAAMVTAAGADPTATTLIAIHQRYDYVPDDPSVAVLLKALQKADNLN
jgi:hypothetical protein